MSTKMATPDFLKIKAFRNKCYGVIIYVHDVTNKILSRDSNYIVDWSCDSSISMREVTTILIL